MGGSVLVVVLLLFIPGCGGKSVATGGFPVRNYDALVLSQKPVMYLTMGNPSSGIQPDATDHNHNGAYLPSTSKPRSALMPNGDAAARFDGRTQYLQVPDSATLSVPKTGVLTLEAWIRPDALQPPHDEGSGYVNFLGKSEHGRDNSEYEMRLYSKVNREVPMRPNRLSVYVFNPSGGEGSGAYVQDPMSVGKWIMLVEVINAKPSYRYPKGYCSIYKNGTWRETVGLTQHQTIPRHGNAPFRVGSCDPRPKYSFFPGAIGKVAVFDRELTPAQVAAQYQAMVGS